MSKYQLEEAAVSALDEASDLIDIIGGNAGSKKEKRLKVWRALAKHFSWNRIGDIHRATDLRVRISGDELNILRAAARQQETEAEREGRKEYRELVARIARLEMRLSTNDPDFHGEDIAALRSGTGMAGDGSGALD